MRKRGSEKRMRLFFLLMSFCGGLVFYAPVALLVRTEAGLDLSQVFFVEVVMSATILLFEIPAGIVSDKIGYKRTVVLSQSLLFLARIIFLIAKDPWLFALERFVEGLAYAVSSGSEQSYLYSYYKEENYAVFNSRAGRAGTAGFIISTLLCSVILKYSSVRVLVALTCVSTFLGLISAIALPPERQTDALPSENKTRVKGMIPKRSLSLFFVLGGISAAYLVVNYFYAVKNERMGMEYGFLSLIILGYSAVEMLSPVIIKRIKKKHYEHWIVITAAASATGFGAIFLLDSLWCLPFLMCVPLGLNIMSCLCDELINERIDEAALEKHRAAVLSVFSMGSNVLDIVFLVVSAGLATGEGNISFLFAAVYMVVVLGLSAFALMLGKRERRRG